MYIEKEFRFEAAHSLNAEGVNFFKCSRIHGHSYILKVRLFADHPCSNGMIMNFVDLKNIVNTAIVDKLDHTLLNESFESMCKEYDLLGFIPANPLLSTCENMSIAFSRIIGKMVEVNETHITKVGITLYETATSHCYCEYVTNPDYY